MEQVARVNNPGISKKQVFWGIAIVLAIIAYLNWNKVKKLLDFQKRVDIIPSLGSNPTIIDVWSLNPKLRIYINAEFKNPTDENYTISNLYIRILKNGRFLTSNQLTGQTYSVGANQSSNINNIQFEVGLLSIINDISQIIGGVIENQEIPKLNQLITIDVTCKLNGVQVQQLTDLII